jgi:hypothetical protein
MREVQDHRPTTRAVGFLVTAPFIEAVLLLISIGSPARTVLTARATCIKKSRRETRRSLWIGVISINQQGESQELFELAPSKLEIQKHNSMAQ